MYTNVCGTSFVTIWKTRGKMFVDIRIFFTVYSLKVLSQQIWHVTARYGTAPCVTAFKPNAVQYGAARHRIRCECGAVLYRIVPRRAVLRRIRCERTLKSTVPHEECMSVLISLTCIG